MAEQKSTKHRHIYQNYRIEEVWLTVDGERHCDDGPAFTEYLGKDRHITLEMWYKDGKHHREDGPAWISYKVDALPDDYKNKDYEGWWVDGKKFCIYELEKFLRLPLAEQVALKLSGMVSYL